MTPPPRQAAPPAVERLRVAAELLVELAHADPSSPAPTALALIRSAIVELEGGAPPLCPGCSALNIASAMTAIDAHTLRCVWCGLERGIPE